MSSPRPEKLTQLLVAWGNGDQAALEQLIPLIHNVLYRLARNYLNRERPGHTLQTSALINEAYLRLLGNNVSWQNRAHFFGIAARVMRQILIDHARSRNYAKRCGAMNKVSFDQGGLLIQGQSDEVIALDEALSKLTLIDPRQGQIVEMRFFGGLTIEETAEALGLSHATVEREWRLARAWLRRRLSK